MNKKDLLRRICGTLDKVNTKYDNIVPKSRELITVAVMVMLTALNGSVGTTACFLFVIIRFIHLKEYWNEWSDEPFIVDLAKPKTTDEDEKVQDDING